MKLKCIHTGSDGNCYLLIDDTGEILMLDLGISKKDISLDSNFDLRKVSGILVSHSHMDHSYELKYFENVGIPLLSYKNAVEKKTFKFGSFAVMPFALYHDVPNFGFIIRNIHSKELYIYATDTSDLPLIKAKANWLVEVNFDNVSLEKRLNDLQENDKGSIEIKVLNRTRKTHMSLETLVDYFCNFTEEILPSKILVCHSSNSNGLDRAKTLEELSAFCPNVKIVDNKTLYDF